MRRFTIKTKIIEAIAMIAIILLAVFAIHSVQIHQLADLNQQALELIGASEDPDASKMAMLERDIVQLVRLIDRFEFIAVALVTVFLLTLGLALERSIVPRLRALQHAADRLGGGDYNHSISQYAPDELGDLNRTFDDMVKNVRQSYEIKASELAEKNLELLETQRSLEQSLAELRAERQSELEKVKELERTKLAMLNVLEDVQAEKAEASKARASLEAILASIPDGVCVINKDGSLRMCNPAGQDMFDVSPEDYEKDAWSDLIKVLDLNRHPLSEEQLPAYRTLATGEPTNGSFYIVQKDANLPVSVMTAPIMHSGEMSGAVSVFRDITEAIRLDEAKSVFVSVASHQLRTPLTAINWFAETLATGEYGKLPVKFREPVELILQSSRRMTKLIRALLSVSRIEMGEVRVAPKPTRLENAVNEVLQDTKGLADKKHLRVEFRPAKKLPVVLIDNDLFKIIVQNLVANAIQYTPERGRVTITMEKKKNDVLIAVADTGIGIPKKQQSRVFEKLFRAENAVKMETDGTGLGLFITKSAVAACGGKIWFESEEHKGTTFYVSVPVKSVVVPSGTKPLMADR